MLGKQEVDSVSSVGKLYKLCKDDNCNSSQLQVPCAAAIQYLQFSFLFNLSGFGNMVHCRLDN